MGGGADGGELEGGPSARDGPLQRDPSGQRDEEAENNKDPEKDRCPLEKLRAAALLFFALGPLAAGLTGHGCAKQAVHV